MTNQLRDRLLDEMLAASGSATKLRKSVQDLKRRLDALGLEHKAYKQDGMTDGVHNFDGILANYMNDAGEFDYGTLLDDTRELLDSNDIIKATELLSALVDAMSTVADNMNVSGPENPDAAKNMKQRSAGDPFWTGFSSNSTRG